MSEELKNKICQANQQQHDEIIREVESGRQQTLEKCPDKAELVNRLYDCMKGGVPKADFLDVNVTPESIEEVIDNTFNSLLYQAQLDELNINDYFNFESVQEEWEFTNSAIAQVCTRTFSALGVSDVLGAMGGQFAYYLLLSWAKRNNRTREEVMLTIVSLYTLVEDEIKENALLSLQESLNQLHDPEASPIIH